MCSMKDRLSLMCSMKDRPGRVYLGYHPDTWPEFVQGSAPPSVHLNQDRLHPLNQNTSPPHPAQVLQGHHTLCCGPLN